MIRSDARVGEIVARDYRSAAVFKKYGIDFCCGGGKDLESACREKKIEPETLLEELERSFQGKPEQNDYHGWSLDRLANHIEEKHHAYVKQTTEDLKQYLAKVTRVHGKHNPELTEIEKSFLVLADELAAHLQKEELILFPFIRKMARSEREGVALNRPHYGSIRNPIRMMEEEHTEASGYLEKIRKLSDGLTPPEHACNTYRVTYRLLDEFENDLKLHVHLENNILFPKAIELENELFSETAGS